MSNLFSKLSTQTKEDLLAKLKDLPAEQQTKILLELLKQPTNTEL